MILFEILLFLIPFLHLRIQEHHSGRHTYGCLRCMMSYHGNYFILHILFAFRFGDYCSFFYLYRIVRLAVAPSNLKRDFRGWSLRWPYLNPFRTCKTRFLTILDAVPATDFHTRRSDAYSLRNYNVQLSTSVLFVGTDGTLSHWRFSLVRIAAFKHRLF